MPRGDVRGGRGRRAQGLSPERYKWLALSNTTIAVLLGMIDQSIVLIALPDIFRGIRVDPLGAGNTGLLLWMILGPVVSAAVLVVSLGRLGDLYGRVRIYNLGFAVFTLFSILLTVSWMDGTAGALWLIGMRIGQGVGGAMLFANSAAILTDAFPPNERGLALGINGIVGMAGSFVGLVLGGLLAPFTWRLVFFVSVPVGIVGTIWSYLNLRETPRRRSADIDWWGNGTFALGLVTLMVGATYGVQPYGGHAMGWLNPFVIGSMSAGIALLALFAAIERRIAQPMFRLELFRIRAFTAANVATGAASMARGGLQFTIIIWLQGIWLPEHGYAFTDTPFRASICMLPLIAGFFAAGPLSGYLSDRYGARPFATGGMAIAAICFALFIILPVDFSYPEFAAILFFDGVGMGLFQSPNRAAVMNSLPVADRGVGAGMNLTFLNSASVLSIGIFFSLMIAGLGSRLPATLDRGLVRSGVPAPEASRVAHLPPGATLFASFLGYNPIGQLLGPKTLHALPRATRRHVTSRTFYPRLVSRAFRHALTLAFAFAIIACVVSAIGSLLRGPPWTAQDHGKEGDDRTEAPAIAALETP